MEMSGGKDLGSPTLGILCEDHFFYDKDQHKLIFLDVVKTRLLTRMTRLHSDGRSAILGKASMLMTQLSWDPSRVLQVTARVSYLASFSRELELKCFIEDLPMELPNNLGGISLPRLDFDTFEKYHKFKLLYLEWVISQPFAIFLRHYLPLSRINVRYPKGSSALSDEEFLINLFSGFKSGSIDDFKSHTGQRMYDRNIVIKLLEQEGIPIPVSPYSGQPINSIVVREARAVLDLIPISKFIELTDRVKVFADLFQHPDDVPKKLSFASYQRKAHKVWRKRIGKLGSSGFFNQENPLPTEHRWSQRKDFGRIKVDFFRRMDGYICRGLLDLGGLNAEPSLRVNFSQKQRCQCCYAIHGFGFAADSVGHIIDEMIGRPCQPDLTPCFTQSLPDVVDDLITF
jgi:hypothetical protein